MQHSGARGKLPRCRCNSGTHIQRRSNVHRENAQYCPATTRQRAWAYDTSMKVLQMTLVVSSTGAHVVHLQVSHDPIFDVNSPQRCRRWSFRSLQHSKVGSVKCKQSDTAGHTTELELRKLWLLKRLESDLCNTNFRKSERYVTHCMQDEKDE